MLRTSFLVLVLMILSFPAAFAETPPPPQPTQDTQEAATPRPEPDLLSFGAGYEGFDKFDDAYSQGGEARTRAADMRLEYRWGRSLASSRNDWVNIGIHPLAGVDVSMRGQLYGFGGFGFDFVFWKHVVMTESEAIGLFSAGNAKPLGSVIEFRSMMEVGWRFDDDIRMTAQASHISNAGITHRNPGEEIAGGYIHIPVRMLFGN